MFVLKKILTQRLDEDEPSQFNLNLTNKIGETVWESGARNPV